MCTPQNLMCVAVSFPLRAALLALFTCGSCCVNNSASQPRADGFFALEYPLFPFPKRYRQNSGIKLSQSPARRTPRTFGLGGGVQTGAWRLGAAVTGAALGYSGLSSCLCSLPACPVTPGKSLCSSAFHFPICKSWHALGGASRDTKKPHLTLKCSH